MAGLCKPLSSGTWVVIWSRAGALFEALPLTCAVLLDQLLLCQVMSVYWGLQHQDEHSRAGPLPCDSKSCV